jgi:hypothetical protein
VCRAPHHRGIWHDCPGDGPGTPRRFASRRNDQRAVIHDDDGDIAEDIVTKKRKRQWLTQSCVECGRPLFDDPARLPHMCDACVERRKSYFDTIWRQRMLVGAARPSAIDRGY